MELKTRKNKNYLIGVLIICGILGIYIVVKVIINEINEYKSANDFTRANVAMMLTYNKNFSIQWDVIRREQVPTKDERITKDDLIYDFAQYKIIPILNYLNSKNESERLEAVFITLGDFISDYNYIVIDKRENVFIKNKNGKNFVKVGEEYVYRVRKEYIRKESFNKMYNEYLHSINENNLEEHFVKMLSEEKIINNKYNYDEIIYEIKNNYDEFYKEYEQEVIYIISEDLEEFVEFLNTEYIIREYDEEGNSQGLKLLKEIETETLEIEYKFTKLERIYSPISKYYNHSFQLDLNNLWEQLRKLDLPMLYC